MSSRSAELFLEAQKYLPGGVSRNTLLRKPHPFYNHHATGCRTVDVDGVDRIDFANNMASLIHGHAHPAIVAAVTEQLAKGTAFTMATETEIDFARHLVGRSPSFDKVRFVNSGTEAVMAAIKVVRAHTGRPKIAKVEGTYHGAYDFAEVSQEPAPHSWGERNHPNAVPLAMGTPQGILHDVVIIPFNDPDAACAILDEHRGELACVLIDPMPHRAGLIPADENFIRALWKWTRDDGALLVFDEVITFRTEVGGMQTRYKVRPDFKGELRPIHGAHSGLEMTYQNDELDDFAQYYDKETFRAFKALSPRPHWEDPIAWDNALEERGAEVWSLMNDARTYVYIAGQERMGEALDKVFRKIVGDDELWERRKAEMVAGRRWAELLY